MMNRIDVGPSHHAWFGAVVAKGSASLRSVLLCSWPSLHLDGAVSHFYQLFSSISGHDLEAACIYLLHNAGHVVEHGRLQETACRVEAGMQVQFN